MEIDTDNITKEVIKKLSQNFIRLCHNEYIRRWQRDNKEKVNNIRREYYKRHNKNVNVITKDKKVSNDNINKINPIEVNRL